MIFDFEDTEDFRFLLDRIDKDGTIIKNAWFTIAGALFSLIIGVIIAYFNGKIPEDTDFRIFCGSLCYHSLLGTFNLSSLYENQ